MKPKYCMHLVVNTHWDREWRWPFEETQMRLKEAVDILLKALEENPDFKSFLTDSQASFIEDYLELRPEKTELVKKLVGDKRLFIGPWYTLPAEFLVSGESLVRNLLEGHRVADRFGGAMKAAYNIFSWGQVSQLPQIYRNFGMDTILFYRGIDQSVLDRLEYYWQAPDGSRMLGITFGKMHRLNFWAAVYRPYILSGATPGKYRNEELGFHVHVNDGHSRNENHYVYGQKQTRDIAAALKGMDGLLETLVHKSATDQLLFLQGFDLEFVDPLIPDLVKEINATIDYGQITISSMPDYIDAVNRELEEKGLLSELQVLKGEMLQEERVDGEFGPLFPGVFSARMPVKLENARTQLMLERYAEPLACFAASLGSEYPGRSMRAAWKKMLQNQQHDGVGGCHVDRVFEATMERYKVAQDIAGGIARDALRAITAKVDHSDLHADEVGLTIFNATCWPYTGVLDCVIDLPVPAQYLTESYVKEGRRYAITKDLLIKTCRGETVRHQVLEVEEETVMSGLRFGNSTGFRALRYHVSLYLEDVPACGYLTCVAGYSANAIRQTESLSCGVQQCENEFLKVRINSNGTVDVKCKETGETYTGLHYFEDEGERGAQLAHYTPYHNGRYTTVNESPGICLAEDGPVKTVYMIEHSWMLPEGLHSEAKIHIPNMPEWIESKPPVRSHNRKALRIRTELTLKKGSDSLEFRTVVVNDLKYHRLRAVFPSFVQTDTCYTDSPFDVVERRIKRPDSTSWHEEASRTFPSGSFVSVTDHSRRGLSVVHKGLHEYEVTDDDSRSIALTLLRCFGSAGAGVDMWREQPLAQLHGEHVFEYAVCFHAPRGEPNALLAKAAQLNAPLLSTQCTKHTGELKEKAKSFIHLEDERLVLTAVKRSEDDSGFVIRFFNPLDERIDTRLHCAFKLKKVKKVTCEEKTIEELGVSAHGIAIAAMKREICSLKLEM